jgi:hypothetical protein
VRLLALLALLLAALPAMPAQGQAGPGQGEAVDITGAEFPARVAGDHPFYINVTVRNKQAVDATVLLNVILYTGQGGTPCDGGRFNHSLSTFQKSVSIPAGEEVRVQGNESFWAQVVNASRLAQDGAYEACVWARAAQCPEGQPFQACFLDFDSHALQVRVRNAPPTVLAAASPARGTTDTTFQFDAGASDADQDQLTLTWDFGDGATGLGQRAEHRFERAGAWLVTVAAWDGFDAAEGRVAVQVDAGRARGDFTPGAPSLALVALAALGALALRRR